MANTTFENAGLYGVFVEMMIYQFKSGFWASSGYHKKDRLCFNKSNVELVEKVETLPAIRYDILKFFRHAKANDYNLFMLGVLVIYRNAEMITEVYKEEGKREADDLIHAMAGVYKPLGDMEVYNKYFGGYEEFKKTLPELTELTDADKKEFTSIGTKLSNAFRHVKTYEELTN